MTRQEMHEFRQRAIEFVRNHFPERHEQMMNLRESDPREFRRRMMELLPRIRQAMTLMERDPEMGRLVIRERQVHFQIEKAGRDYSETDSVTTRDAIRRDIRRMAEEMHEIRSGIAEHKIAQLEKRLEQVRNRLERDRERKNQRIEEFIEKLGILEK